jgi:hypothetical protein
MKDLASASGYSPDRPLACSSFARLLAVLLVGCGGEKDDLPRRSVAGTVTLDGKPLSQGSIQFLPTGPDTPTAAMVEVKGGTYTITTAQGLVPGHYKVLISSANVPASDPAKADALPGMSGPPLKELLPVRYNAQSTLSAEVKTDAPNAFDFLLSSK